MGDDVLLSNLKLEEFGEWTQKLTTDMDTNFPLLSQQIGFLLTRKEEEDILEKAALKKAAEDAVLAKAAEAAKVEADKLARYDVTLSYVALLRVRCDMQKCKLLSYLGFEFCCRSKILSLDYPRLANAGVTYIIFQVSNLIPIFESTLHNNQYRSVDVSLCIYVYIFYG